jgi:uncharacterized lipoprotein YajG
MTKTILAALAASFLAAGCATEPVDANAEPRAEREYRTGSNIAKRSRTESADGVSTVSREELERHRSGSLPGGTIPKGN